MSNYQISPYMPNSAAEAAPLPKGTRVRVARTLSGEHPEMVGGIYSTVARFENVPQLVALGLSGREYRLRYGTESCLAVPAEYLQIA